jgi:hypothetical protein
MTIKDVISNVAVINESTVVTDAQVYALTYSLQLLTQNDFYPAWGIKSHIYNLDKSKPLPKGHWALVILDNANQAGALGYHDLTNDGYPLGKVFAKTTMDAGENWTVTASHELLEMLADPYINLTTFNQTGNNSGRILPYEICDAVQGSNCTFRIEGLEMSNFVYPTWFEGFRPAKSCKFDFMGVLSEPFEIYHEGYISYFDVPNTRGWQQIFAKVAPNPKVGHSQARKLLRARPKKSWKVSTAK